jgi:hypothetical protein
MQTPKIFNPSRIELRGGLMFHAVAKPLPRHLTYKCIVNSQAAKRFINLY